MRSELLIKAREREREREGGQVGRVGGKGKKGRRKRLETVFLMAAPTQT